MSNVGTKLMVFDCDGTLVDSQHSIIASMHAAFDAHDVPRPSREAIRRVVGLPLLDAVAFLAPGSSQSLIASMRDEYSNAWQQLRETEGLDEPLYPDVITVLDQLDGEGWLLGVATGKSRRGLDGTLEKHDILGRFVTLQTADRARGKPHPEMLLQAMNETGASASQTVMIGDTTFDMEMACNARVMAIGVSWGYHEVEELQATGAVDVINGFEELSGVLANKFKSKMEIQ
jgi:phosphoglycolate phosphatase